MKSCLVLIWLIVFNISKCEKSKELLYSKEFSSMEYYTMPHEITIPIVINADKALRDKLMAERNLRRFRTMIKKIVHEMEGLFRHPSLNQKVNFNLIDINFLRNRSNLLKMDENSSRYLESYCNIHSTKKIANKKWYYSILITGLDFYYENAEGQKVKSSTGRGYFRGMCTAKKSCTLVEWQPKNMAYLLAHEIGHRGRVHASFPQPLAALDLLRYPSLTEDYLEILGIPHDGSWNKCKPLGNIMGSQYDPAHQPKSWSKCSKRHLKVFLMSRRAWCLRLSNVNKSFEY